MSELLKLPPSAPIAGAKNVDFKAADFAAKVAALDKGRACLRVDAIFPLGWKRGGDARGGDHDRVDDECAGLRRTRRIGGLHADHRSDGERTFTIRELTLGAPLVIPPHLRADCWFDAEGGARFTDPSSTPPAD